MNVIEKYYNFYIPALNKEKFFKREGACLFVKLKDEEVTELGSDRLRAVFPRDLTVSDVKGAPLKAERTWIVSCVVKDWEE